MKPIFLILFLLFATQCLYAQKFLLRDRQTGKEFVRKDSAGAVRFLDSLSQNRYYFTKVISAEKKGSNTNIIFDKGRDYNTAQIKLDGETSEITNLKTDFFTKNLDSLKQAINAKYVELGYPFSRVQSKFSGIKNDIPVVEISVSRDKRRTVDAFALKGYEKTPARFKKELNKEFVGKTYTEKTLSTIGSRLQNHPFLVLERPPQTLFTKDSTSVYLFLQKKKVNTFDGVIGFGNDKNQKFSFTGNLNVQFRNLFNGFESIGLNWQRSPDRSQTFDLQIDIPYLFGSGIGTELRTNIYRQDSAYANVRFLPSLYYNFGRTMRAGLRGTFENSVVLDSIQTSVRDFTRKGAGIWYDYSNPGDVSLFLYKTKIRAEADAIMTNYAGTNEKIRQMHYYVSAEHNTNLGGNHWLNLKGESAIIDAKQPLSANELLRFGGWNSMRGFNENSLLGDFYYFGSAEYRYLIGKQAFFDVFGQYGQLRNMAADLRPKLYSFGLGFNFFLPIGLMSFQISSGNQTGNAIKFGDTKIHWGIMSRF